MQQTESSSRGLKALRNCATHQKRTGGSQRKIKVPVEKDTAPREDSQSPCNIDY